MDEPYHCHAKMAHYALDSAARPGEWWLPNEPEPRVAGELQVRAEEVQTALGEAIQVEPASRIMPALDGLSGTRRKRWGIGNGLVERAAKEPPGERRIWLEAAKVGNTATSDRKGHEAYRALLDAAAEGDSVDDVVGELRGRLG